MTEAYVPRDFASPPTATLTPKDAQVLLEGLVQGDQALARRKDLGDLYKRIVGMLTTLDTGLNDRQTARAAAEHQAMSERLDRLEHAINGIEGVLRIEMEQVVRRAIADAGLDPQSDRSGHPLARRLLQLAVLCACVLAGAALSDRILPLGRVVGTYARTVATLALHPQSPDGGSASPENQVK